MPADLTKLLDECAEAMAQCSALLYRAYPWQAKRLSELVERIKKEKANERAETD